MIEDFTGTDGKPYHGGLRTVGGDGNYEQEFVIHDGKAAGCRRCNGATTTQPVDPVTRLRTLRRARYGCAYRYPSGRKCLAPASRVALSNGKPEARCAEHEHEESA